MQDQEEGCFLEEDLEEDSILELDSLDFILVCDLVSEAGEEEVGERMKNFRRDLMRVVIVLILTEDQREGGPFTLMFVL